MSEDFRDRFIHLFHARFESLHRLLHRRSGDADLASDLAQDAFAALYRRGTIPEAPEAWLVTVALNRLRNARVRSARRRVLRLAHSGATAGDAPPGPAEAVEAVEARDRVRRALEHLPERERDLLLLRAEGFRYREIARTLELNEASVGTLLRRAKQAFLDAYEGGSDAS